MPRRIHPRWCADTVSETKPVNLTRLTSPWFGLCGAPDRAALRAVYDELRYIAARHKRARAQEAEQSNRAESNAALRRIADTASRLSSARSTLERAEIARLLKLQVLSMDDGAHWALARAMAVRTGDRSVFGDYNAIVRRTDILPEVCLAAVDTKGGRPIDRTLNLTIESLLLLYEQLTKRQTTHSAAVNGQYDGEPRSRAGKLVLAFMKHIEPTIPPQSISTALTGYVRAKRRHSAA
jgi:hypothetical protein